MGGIVAIFFKENGFYPIEFSGKKPASEEAADHAALNPDIIRIEDIHSNVLWKKRLQ
ncbi:MAG: hypothetical protein ITG03_06380 [Sphingorhabdus sp.]|nr:hypothetical protein [Sphingorhabdus sp.]